MDAKSLIIFLVIGVIAGWLASLVVGRGRGLLYYLILGVVGAFVGGWLFGALGIRIGSDPLISSIITATVGAIVAALVARAIT